MSLTIFMQLPVVCSWFVTFSWFVGSSRKNKFSEQVCEPNVYKLYAALGTCVSTYSISVVDTYICNSIYAQ